jgi:septal ring factor EnvC (AmiA/AmiB activator)
MVAMGRETAQQEAELSSYEEKLAILEDQKAQKTKAFNARQDELSAMISAMIKLKQLPPEAIIAMPGKLDETLETARALAVFTRAIEEEAQSLKAELRELDALEDTIRAHRAVIESRKATLANRQAALAAKMKERNALVESLGGEEQSERLRVANLTARSKSLQELVDSLQKSENGWERRKPIPQKQREAKPREKMDADHKLRSFENAKGQLHLPAAGKIVSRYGNRDAGDTFSKGIVIETRESADVVAPFDGQVVFAGPFRDYGSIVIIRHGGQYHTMLSGMDVIDCKPGQFLLEGEPIGSMGSGRKTRLYMELREGGRPVDPAAWIKS